MCTIDADCKTSEPDNVVPQTLPANLRGINIIYNGEKSATLKPSLFERYSNLTSVTISGRAITSIKENTFVSLKHLECLSIYKTTINDFPQQFLPPQSDIEFIDFGNNLLTDIPSGIFRNLPALTHLDLGFNHIAHNSCTTIGEEFTNLSKLTELDLSNMTIPNECKSNVPDDFFLPLHRTVTYLNLTISNIYQGSQAIFANFTNFETLDISIAKRFTSCPADAEELFLNLPKTLKQLVFRRWRTNRDMNETCIVTNKTLRGLRELPYLATIDTLFSDFMFGEVLNKSVFAGFQSLKNLNIGYNRFALIEDDAFYGCLNLTLLHIDGNSLGSRPFKLFQNRSQSNLCYLSTR
ncbi:toll-like receptor 3 [Watersipora subatra]|uniref:toll-like receptor 3 n=1 Tax=Watersipora subatra TaxID=2589382 RepID=UPI00355BA5B2